jgi:hypothetical protein
VIDADTDEVVALEMPSTLVKQVNARYKKNHTVLDRVFELYKSGSGKEGTTYQADAEAPSKLAKAHRDLEPYDVEAIIQSEVEADQGDEDDLWDESPRRKSKGKAKPSTMKVPGGKSKGRKKKKKGDEPPF